MAIERPLKQLLQFLLQIIHICHGISFNLQLLQYVNTFIKHNGMDQYLRSLSAIDLHQ